jgi:hypothetical protein
MLCIPSRSTAVLLVLLLGACTTGRTVRPVAVTPDPVEVAEVHRDPTRSSAQPGQVRPRDPFAPKALLAECLDPLFESATPVPYRRINSDDAVFVGIIVLVGLVLLTAALAPSF